MLISKRQVQLTIKAKDVTEHLLHGDAQGTDHNENEIDSKNCGNYDPEG